jgi:hypothetical protein
MIIRSLDPESQVAIDAGASDAARLVCRAGPADGNDPAAAVSAIPIPIPILRAASPAGYINLGYRTLSGLF